MRALPLTALAVTAAIGIGVGAEAAAGAPPRAGASALHTLDQLAARFTTSNGDATVHQADVILTTRQNAAGGDGVPSNQPVFEIVLRGQFTCNMCSRPPSSLPITGTVIFVTVDRATLQITDWGISDRLPPPGDGSFTIAF